MLVCFSKVLGTKFKSELDTNNFFFLFFFLVHVFILKLFLTAYEFKFWNSSSISYLIQLQNVIHNFRGKHKRFINIVLQKTSVTSEMIATQSRCLYNYI